MTKRSRIERLTTMVAVVALTFASCGQGESNVDPGPEETDTSSTTSTTTTTVPEETNEEDIGEDDEVVTEADDSSTTSAAPVSTPDESEDTGAALELLEDTENAPVYVELADSGLVLSVEEQTCVDETAAAATTEGADELDSVIGAVQDCASPRAMDDFASTLILAGGQPLPPTEAACVSSRIRDGESYRPFWATLLEEEPFDFLLADGDVQNQYLDLYADCVSVGRATAEQTNVPLSIPSMGCIDDLYADREFVRVTIEADLSGNVEDLARIDSQLQSCLTDDERELIYGG